MLSSSDSELEQYDQSRATSTFINGTLAAYCDQEHTRRGWWGTTLGYYAYKSRSETTHRESARLESEGPQPICRQYMLSAAFSTHYAIISCTAIFLGNMLFILIAEPLVALIGMNYATNEQVAVSLTIFLCLLLNSCAVPILLQANFSADYQDGFWDSTFSDGGRNSDFGATWYPDIGPQLAINAIALSVQPILNVMAEMTKLRYMRHMQRTRWYARHDNNQVDNIKFLELHAGPEHQFQRKTASLNAVLFMALALGTAFPILYPIALFAITIQYIVERYTLALFYRLPPKFSLELTERNTFILAFGPLCGMAISFWLFGSYTMFNADATGVMATANDVLPSHHSIG